MKIHVLGLPHTQTTTEFSTCAFTMKVWNLCKMLTRRGHHVIHYGVEGSNPECSENVQVVSRKQWGKHYKQPGADFYNFDSTGKFSAYHATWASHTRASLASRIDQNRPWSEIICVTWGDAQWDAANGLKQLIVESGIGYKHARSEYRVYESYAWMHMHMGAAGLYDGNKFYWAVIPNAFDVSMFDFRQKRGKDLLYIGRLNEDKGVKLAIEIAKAAERQLIIVGQGDPKPHLAGNPHVKYMPPVDVEGRRKLLRTARAVICPSLYVEPFCGVHIEAQLAGAPVITTDWGAFAEGVLHGVTGFRCRTFEQFVWAAKNVDQIDPAACRQWASANYSLERVALMYEEYFQSVLNLHPDPRGFYLPNPQRKELGWLQRSYPSAATAPIDLARAYVVPHAEPAASTGEWDKAQRFEREWWGLDWSPRWDEEIKKQETYFRLIGFPTDRDFGKKSILDVGCGPVSILQRSKHGPSRGVDPLAVSNETRKRYRKASTELLNIKAEDMPVDRAFDEVWMYNCLQHVDDPRAILSKIVQMGREVRIFEWIDLPPCQGHPHTLTEAMFQQYFGGDDYERPIWNVGELRDFAGTSTNKYVAIHAIRKNPPPAASMV